MHKTKVQKGFFAAKNDNFPFWKIHIYLPRLIKNCIIQCMFQRFGLSPLKTLLLMPIHVLRLVLSLITNKQKFGGKITRNFNPLIWNWETRKRICLSNHQRTGSRNWRLSQPKNGNNCFATLNDKCLVSVESNSSMTQAFQTISIWISET